MDERTMAPQAKATLFSVDEFVFGTAAADRPVNYSI